MKSECRHENRCRSSRGGLQRATAGGKCVRSRAPGKALLWSGKNTPLTDTENRTLEAHRGVCVSTHTNPESKTDWLVWIFFQHFTFKCTLSQKETLSYHGNSIVETRNLEVCHDSFNAIQVYRLKMIWNRPDWPEKYKQLGATSLPQENSACPLGHWRTNELNNEKFGPQTLT